MSFEWLSPAGQQVRFPSVPAEAWGDSALRACPTCEPLPLLEVCCREGFWNMKQAFVVRMCRHLDITLPDGADLYDSLEASLRKVMGPRCSDEDMLKFLDQRIAAMAEVQQLAATETSIMESEDAADCLCAFDKQDFVKERKTTVAKVGEARAFASRLRDRRASVQVAVRASAKAKAGGGAASSSRGSGSRMKLPKGAITQAEAKLLAPPDSYIWRNESSQSWCGCIKPMGSISRSWMCHGHKGACVKVLRELWNRAFQLGRCQACRISACSKMQRCSRPTRLPAAALLPSAPVVPRPLARKPPSKPE